MQDTLLTNYKKIALSYFEDTMTCMKIASSVAAKTNSTAGCPLLEISEICNSKFKLRNIINRR